MLVQVQTGTYNDWSKPVYRVDNAACHHDLAYQHFPDTATRIDADRLMIEEKDAIKDLTLRERIERGIIKLIIDAKQKFGMGVKKSLIKWSDELAKKLHKPVIHHFRKRREYVKGIDEILAADLVDM